MKFLYEFKVLLICFQNNFHCDLLVIVPTKHISKFIKSAWKVHYCKYENLSFSSSSRKNNVWKVSHYDTVYFLRYTQRHIWNVCLQKYRNNGIWIIWIIWIEVYEPEKVVKFSNLRYFTFNWSIFGNNKRRNISFISWKINSTIFLTQNPNLYVICFAYIVTVILHTVNGRLVWKSQWKTILHLIFVDYAMYLKLAHMLKSF